LRIIAQQQNLERRLVHDSNFNQFRSIRKWMITYSHSIHLT